MSKVGGVIRCNATSVEGDHVPLRDKGFDLLRDRIVKSHRSCRRFVFEGGLVNRDREWPSPWTEQGRGLPLSILSQLPAGILKHLVAPVYRNTHSRTVESSLRQHLRIFGDVVAAHHPSERTRVHA